MPQFFTSLIPRLLLLAVAAVALPPSVQATPRITEFMAANDSGLADEDGAFSDWIEIENTAAQPISLAGYYLTDDQTQLTRWQFPAVTLNAGAYLVVFASGKDRTNPAATLHTDFELAAAGEYLALIAPDGRTVVSEFAPSYPEQFDNESFGWIDPPAVTFFSTPTPGAANGAGRRAGASFGAASRNPAQPVTGPLVVTALLRPTNAPVARATVYYRLMFGAETSLAMTDDGLGGDSFAGDGIWTAIIPATAFVPGDMTRWRFVAADSGNVETREPAFRSATDSHQYFGTVTHDPATQTGLSVLHWFTSNPGGGGTAAGSRGALYYDGEFYDNVLFNLHGQSSSGFPKKSYNIDFNRTQRFRWSPDAPRVADIDLLTNWADKSKVRHVLGYEVMRQSGVAAHFAFTVRVEQNGTFFSTADFVEDADEIYLERAGLNPEGALYKVYANVLNKDSGNNGTSGVEKKTRRSENNADLQALIDGLDLTGSALTNYLYDNIDIPKCVNMLAANSVIRNIDMHSKNWYIYRDTGRSNEWAILPWDLDLSHGRVWNTANTYFDNAIYLDGFVVNGTSIRLVSQLFSQAPTRAMLMRRIRTLTDRFLQAPPTAGTPESALYYERRLNEQSALIDPPGISPSDAARDFQKWGSWLQRGTVVPSTHTDPAVETMAEGIQRWKNEYLPGRRNFIYNTQIVGKGGEIPLPQRSGAAEPVINFGTIDFNPASANQDQEYIELLNPNTIAVDISDWRLTGAIEHTFAGGTVIPANRALYLCPDAAAFRARTVSPRGGEGRLVQGGYRGHLSNLGETLQLIDSSGVLNNSTSYQGQPSAVQRYLVISEVMFQPPGDGLAEYIELINISNSETLDLTGVRFTEGVSFAFTGSAITSLAPGARVLVVRDAAAFQAAHGAGHPVAGVFADGSALGNGGDSIKLEDPTNGTIQEFTYDDATPWPGGTDGAGYSLVLIAPQTNPDPSLASNWRSSAAVGGTPDSNDLLALPADPTGDANANGIVDLIDYALGSDGGRNSIAPHFARQTGVSGPVGSLLFVYPIQLGADRAEIRIFVSTDLTSWRDGMADLEIVSNEHLGDGRALLSWRVKSPLAEEPRLFIRLRITPR